jgi:CheY-like chemotaxis protein/hemoglobin-like flavoprotein
MFIYPNSAKGTPGTKITTSGLPPSDIARIRKSFYSVADRGEWLASRFYEGLLAKSPDLQVFFPPENLAQQKTKFLKGLLTVVQHLDRPEELRAILTELGRRHQEYGVTVHHYPPVLHALLETLAETGGEGMDGVTYESWAHLLQLIRVIMLDQPFTAVPTEVRNNPSGDRTMDCDTKRILLIDDDQQLLDLYQAYLEHQGFLCGRVSEVNWAAAHLGMSRYDVVFTDFQMPRINGIQLKITLDDTMKGHCPPFVLVTGSLSPEIKKRAFQAGFAAVLKKPHDLGELIPVIRLALKES